MKINDEKGLMDSCIQGKNLGFDGKSLIHPNQICMTNKLFSPSEEDIEKAYRMIEQYKIALRDGKGVMLMDDKLVEQLHIDQAEILISEYENIMRLEKLRGNE
jgi:citrate lyase subunit beta/citryl-CoA lyase